MSTSSRPRSPQVAPTTSPYRRHSDRCQTKIRGMNHPETTKCPPKPFKSKSRPKSADYRRSCRDLGCIKSAPELPCFRKTFARTPSDSEGEFITISSRLSETKVNTKSTSSINEILAPPSGGFFNRLFSRSRSRERHHQETLETQCLLECASVSESPSRNGAGAIVNHGRKVSDVGPTANNHAEVKVDEELEVKVHHYKSLSPHVSSGIELRRKSSSSSSNRHSFTPPVASALRMCPTPPLAVFSSDEDISSVPPTPQKHANNDVSQSEPRTSPHRHDHHISFHSSRCHDDVTVEHGDDMLVVTRRCPPQNQLQKSRSVLAKQKSRASYHGDMLITRPTVSIVTPDVNDELDSTDLTKPKTISPELEERISQLFLKENDQMTTSYRPGSKPYVLRSQSLQEPPRSPTYLSTASITIHRSPSPLADDPDATILSKGGSTLYSPSKVIRRPKYSRRKHYTIDFGSLPEAVGCTGATPEVKSTRRSVILRQTSLHSYFHSMQNNGEMSDTATPPQDVNTSRNDLEADIPGQSKVIFRKVSPCHIRSRKRSSDYLPYVSSLPSMTLPILHFDSQAPKPMRAPDTLPDTRLSRQTRMSRESHTRDSQDYDDDLSLDVEQLPLLLAEVASNDSGIQQDETPTSCESFKLQSHLETISLLSPLRNRADSPRRFKRDRPKSECLTVRWADTPGGATLLPLPEYSLDGSTAHSMEGATEVIRRASRARGKDRPKSDLGTCPGLSDAIQSLLNRDNQSSSSSIVSPEGSVTDSRRNLRNRRMSTPQPIRSRASQSVSYLQSRSTRLKKARSAPDLLDIDEFGRRKVRRKRDLFRVSLSTAGDLAVQPHDYSSDSDSEDSASYGAASMSGSSLSLRQQATLEEIFEDSESPTYAEALWDHVTMDTEELGFRAGNVIEVTDLSDRNWWFGHMGDRQGWFPAPFVRLRANQIEIITDGDSSPLLPEHSAMTSLKAPLRHTESVSQAQARTNVVREILHAEREYVRHLRDVVQGYVEKCRKHPEMFSEDKLTAIFGNITAIYGLSIKFLAELEAHIDTEKPYLSNIGKVFLDHQTGFEIYSEYCNNHPTGCEELRVLQKHKKYTHFFEACRLLQNMIELPLEGFLLTPVQKICKYPLQLRELLKYTPRSHSDHMDISAALETMHRIAVMINERKRKMESLEKLAEWQLTIDDWQGQDLLDLSSELIYSGEMTKVNNGGWHQDRVFFLFDHQLIYCKKDMLWRDMLIYKGRIDLDNCVIKALPDDKDPIFNINVKNAIRIYDNAKGKWYLLYCRTPIERARWFSAFQDERQRVEEDNKNGFNLKEFRSKAHLPRGKGKVQPASVRYREHTKKQNKKHGGRHPKNNDKHKAQNAAPSTDNVDENCDSTHTKRWYNFGNRKANKR